MARIRLKIEFHLDVDLWIRQSCLARSIFLSREQLEVELRLPPFEDVVPSSITWDSLDFRGYGGAASGRHESPFPVRVAVNRFQVIIREEVTGISRSDLEGANASTVPALISKHQQERIKWAERLSISFLDRLRARGQTWLGPTGTISYSVAPHAITYEDETNFRFVFGHGGTFVVPPRPEIADLDPDSFEELAGPLASNTALPLPESFLADADHFSEQASENDFRRAVLLAAIGCELKVKETLRRKVFDAGLPLVEALIANPRDFSMSAAALFDKGMKAATGHSLKEEDRDLYRSIDTERGLFFLRNKIAHSGMGIQQEDAKRCVNSAREAFAWLDNVQTAANLPTDTIL